MIDLETVQRARRAFERCRLSARAVLEARRVYGTDYGVEHANDLDALGRVLAAAEDAVAAAYAERLGPDGFVDLDDEGS